MLMQQIHCPNCGTVLRAENINIQDKLGVCPNCNNVFHFEAPKEKVSRRKIKQPKALSLREDEDSLEMRFRTNFRLDRNETVVSSSILIGFLLPITGLLFSQYLERGTVPLLVPLITSFFTVFFAYILALTVYNETELVMDANSIHVARKPLPNLTNQGEEISLSGVTEIRCEETPASIKNAYDTPRYNVWAILADGNRKLIVADMIYDYGFFIAQRLQERLDADSVENVSRLEDVEGEEVMSEEAPYEGRKASRA
jgi:hypothetical protein